MRKFAYQLDSAGTAQGWQKLKQLFVVIFYLIVVVMHVHELSEAMERLFYNAPASGQVQKTTVKHMKQHKKQTATVEHGTVTTTKNKALPPASHLL